MSTPPPTPDYSTDQASPVILITIVGLLTIIISSFCQLCLCCRPRHYEGAPDQQPDWGKKLQYINVKGQGLIHYTFHGISFVLYLAALITSCTYIILQGSCTSYYGTQPLITRTFGVGVQGFMAENDKYPEEESSWGELCAEARLFQETYYMDTDKMNTVCGGLVIGGWVHLVFLLCVWIFGILTVGISVYNVRKYGWGGFASPISAQLHLLLIFSNAFALLMPICMYNLIQNQDTWDIIIPPEIVRLVPDLSIGAPFYLLFTAFVLEFANYVYIRRRIKGTIEESLGQFRRLYEQFHPQPMYLDNNSPHHGAPINAAVSDPSGAAFNNPNIAQQSLTNNGNMSINSGAAASSYSSGYAKAGMRDEDDRGGYVPPPLPPAPHRLQQQQQQ